MVRMKGLHKKVKPDSISLSHAVPRSMAQSMMFPARMGKWVPHGQNQGMMPKLDPYGSHIGILAHVGPT